MSEQEFRVEITGNIKVYHPIKRRDHWVDEINKAWDAAIEQSAQRITQRGEVITFYREVEERRAA